MYDELQICTFHKLLMKKTFSTIIFITISLILFGQSHYEPVRISRTGCLPEGIRFETQAQVDSFPINYPGCNTILGDVYISGSSITSLQSLIQLNRIEGYLGFGYESLNSLSGLDSVHYLGRLEISGLEFSFQGLGNLDTIGGSLVNQGGSRTDLSGLENLKYIGGDLEIKWNDGLVNLNGLNGVKTINGNLEVEYNQFLSDFSGLDSLQYINGSVYIERNFDLISLTGLEGLQMDSLKNLTIGSNGSLAVCNLPFVCQVLDNPPCPVNIYNNAPECNSPGIIAAQCGISLSCLPFGNYYITSQYDADHFNIDYPECSQLNGSLMINGNDITNLSGLINITSIEGSLTLYSNDLLQDFTGLDSLQTIDHRFQVGMYEGLGNPSLRNFHGLENLTSVGEIVNVLFNSSLQSMQGLNNLNNVAFQLNITGNESLLSLDGLNGLDSVSNSVSVSGNISLNDISALLNLRHTEFLDIRYNDNLTSLHGIDSINVVYGISIENNPLLDDCAVKSICDALAMPDYFLDVSNNATGCNTHEEIEDACLHASTYDVDNPEPVTIYPNPPCDFFFIDLPQSEQSAQLSFVNLSGQVVQRNKVLHSGQYIDIKSLPKGLYLVHLVGEKGVYYGKIVIQ